MANSSILAGMQDAQRLLNDVISLEINNHIVARFANELADTFYRGKKVLCCGNGGSFTDATHFAEEFTGRFNKDRKPYPVIPLSDGAHLTCTANDYGYEHVFSRLVEAYGEKGDMLLVLSTSGKSPNILKAIETAKAKDMFVAGFLGMSGGDAASKCDIAIKVPHEDSARIQEIHMMMLHLAIEAVERSLGH